jgi:ATP-binding cassette subfamily F protein 3
LDMRSKEILKNALASFDGTVLVVSHDRDFLDGLVNCIYEFRNKKAKQHLGGIFDFLQRKKIESLKELEAKKTSNSVKKALKEKRQSSEESLSFEQKKEINRNISRMEKLVVKTEEDISTLENKIEEMDQLLSSAKTIEDHSVFNDYDQLKEELDKTMENWEEHHEKLEEWKSKKIW